MGWVAEGPGPSLHLRLRASAVFTPAAPVHQLALFRGRLRQIEMALEALQQPGQHAVVYGERGVGKTSLVSVIGETLIGAGMPGWRIARVDCDAGDAFASLWRKAFRQLAVTDEGVTDAAPRSLAAPPTLAEWLGADPTPDDVRRVGALVPGRLLVVLDEFDQLAGRRGELRLLANTVKTLSDARSRVTLVFVGVADSVAGLLAEHGSIDRCLAQIRMPRMAAEEIGAVLRGGFGALGCTVDDQAIAHACALVQGLPAPAHYIGLQCAYRLADSGRAARRRCAVRPWGRRPGLARLPAS